jgi:3-deoxy-manno-octulosonate cytidylyltransferase (CMP-KDO synthetase)
VIAVIPARYGSTRLAAKPLADIHGKPMIQWVYERTRQARGVDQVVVATDDSRIADVVRRFDGQVVMTSPDIQSGTDRVAAVADAHPADIYINVQGDSPMIDPRAIEAGLALVSSGRFRFATVMAPFHDASDLDNPAAVKVIADTEGRAIYFSRHPIPYSRGPRPPAGEPLACRKHIGLYIYDRETLFRFRALPPSALEKAEVLEQLRALANGIPIGIVEHDFESVEVDTPEDLEKVRKLLRK